MTRSENSEKNAKLMYPIEEWPEFLVDAYNEPIILSRVNGIGRPPTRELLIDTYHKNNCGRCDKEYYIELSKADENEQLCGVRCERLDGYDEIIESGIVHQILNDRIPKLCY